jgi:hypothetical protein
LGEHTVGFGFQLPDLGTPGSIMVEGRWEVRDAEGHNVDQVQEHATREAYRVHRLLSRDVVSSTVDAPRSFALLLDSGDELRVFDDSERYESFAIKPGNIFV